MSEYGSKSKPEVEESENMPLLVGVDQYGVVVVVVVVDKGLPICGV